MLEAASDFLSLQVAAHGYLVTFTAMFIENLAFAGLVMPGDSILLLTGFYAQGTPMWLPGLVAAGTAGAVIGDSLAYLLGRTAGGSVSALLSRRSAFFERRLEASRRYFRAHGGKTVFTGRFVMIVRAFIPFLAGTGNMPFAKFLLYTVSGAFVQISLLLTLGYFLGSYWLLLSELVGRVGLVLLAIVVAGGLLLLGRRKLQALRT